MPEGGAAWIFIIGFALVLYAVADHFKDQRVIREAREAKIKDKREQYEKMMKEREKEG